MTDYGETLNTVAGRKCPTCSCRGPMTVHPKVCVYRVCGHTAPLPPLRSTRAAAKPKVVCPWCFRRVEFSPITNRLVPHRTKAKRRGKRRNTAPVCGGSNQHRDAKPQPAPIEREPA